MAKTKFLQTKKRSRGKFLFSLFFFLAFVFCWGWVYNSVYEFTTAPHTFPVSRVVINGKFKYITKAEIADVVGKLAGGKNLIALDLAPVHNALVQMPWVASASVVKKIPDTLEVNLVEHFPSALWKSTGVYDAQTNSVFYPDMQKLNLPLVTLSAPHDSLAGDLYEHASSFIELTRNTPYHIEEVQLDVSRGYRVRIDGGVWLILGRESSPELPLIRLKRFILAFPETKLSLSEVDYIDLRYDNGFAVGEKGSSKESNIN